MHKNLKIQIVCIYFVLFLIIAGIVITALLLDFFLGQFLHFTSLHIFKLTTVVIISVFFLPMQNAVQNTCERLFFFKQYQYKQAVMNFSKTLLSVLDLRPLLDSIVNHIYAILEIKSIAILIFDPGKNIFQVKVFKGFNDSIRQIHFLPDSKLIQLLYKEKAAIKKSDILHYYAHEPALLSQMEQLQAQICVPFFFSGQMLGILALGEREKEKGYHQEEVQVLEIIANEASIALSNAYSYHELKNTYLGTIEAFAYASEAKDFYAQGHAKRVMKLALTVAVEMGLNRQEIEALKYASLLHDIGMIGISDQILNKPGSLTDLEWQSIYAHPSIACTILSPVKFLENIKDVILHHHEHWNGNGYPDKLKGNSIPLLSRIIHLADSFDAMTSFRTYRRPMNPDYALREIERKSSIQFDPDVVSAFTNLFRHHQDLLNGIIQKDVPSYIQELKSSYSTMNR